MSWRNATRITHDSDTKDAIGPSITIESKYIPCTLINHIHHTNEGSQYHLDDAQ